MSLHFNTFLLLCIGTRYEMKSNIILLNKLVGIFYTSVTRRKELDIRILYSIIYCYLKSMNRISISQTHTFGITEIMRYCAPTNKMLITHICSVKNNN